MRVLIASLVVLVVHGGCVSSGTDVCASFSAAQSLCADPTVGGQLGCVWNGASCALSATCSNYGTMTTCQAALNGACVWNDPLVCDASDILFCSGSQSRYLSCLTQNYTAFLNGLYANFDTSVDLNAHLQATIDSSMCTCLNEYFTCIYDGECGRDSQFLAGWNGVCGSVFDAFAASRPGLTGCQRTWCNIGRTATVSTFQATFTFDPASLPSTWTQSRRDAFVAAIGAELGGVKLEWITFDAATGQLSVSIPAGSAISAEQLTQIKATWLTWGNPSSSNAAPVFDAMGVQSGQSTAQASEVNMPTNAPVPSPTLRPASSGERVLVGAAMWLSFVLAKAATMF